ncbi:MAG: hypothetical protein LUD38_03385, partial [Parabacteroides sp.]|nr:hypothetical protein [Parabacteroides sp.]
MSWRDPLKSTGLTLGIVLIAFGLLCLFVRIQYFEKEFPIPLELITINADGTSTIDELRRLQPKGQNGWFQTILWLFALKTADYATLSEDG